MLELLMLTLSYPKDGFKRIAAAVSDIIRNGGVIAYPTESFYALGVLADDEAAVRKLFEIKKRPSDKPLPLVVGTIDVLKSIVMDVPAPARELMDQYWPGPLTILFRSGKNIPELLTGGTGKVAVRIPGESAALELAKAVELPMTATSANISSMPPAEDADSVKEYFHNKIDLLIDGGRAPGGKPSTIVDITGSQPVILRQGSILLDE